MTEEKATLLAAAISDFVATIVHPSPRQDVNDAAYKHLIQRLMESTETTLSEAFGGLLR